MTSATNHPVVTRTLIFGVDQYKFNRRNRCRRTGASRPRCAARIPDRSTGTVDVYAQHAFPPKVSGRTTRPRCVRGGQPDWPGIASSFRASRVRPIQLSRSVRMVGAHSKFTFGLSIMRGSRAARGGQPKRQELHLLFARHEYAPSSFLDPFTWSVRTRN